MVFFNFQAGIPSDNLQISLEPEAASIYCQHLPIENLKGAGKRLSATVAGTRCIIADLGGTSTGFCFIGSVVFFIESVWGERCFFNIINKK